MQLESNDERLNYLKPSLLCNIIRNQSMKCTLLHRCDCYWCKHYSDVIMAAMAYQITSLMTVYSTVYSGADQRKYQSSASLAFVRGIHRSPVNSPHKWPVLMFLFDDVIMNELNGQWKPCTESDTMASDLKWYCIFTLSLSCLLIKPMVLSVLYHLQS